VNNLIADFDIRYGSYGGIARRHTADNYIARFSRFIRGMPPHLGNQLPDIIGRGSVLDWAASLN
jgi:hypothetical protein